MSDMVEAFHLSAEVHENGLSVLVTLYDLQDDEPEFHWRVKWDGCVNYETDQSCMGHLCTFTDWQRIHDAGIKAYHLAMSLMDKALPGAKNDPAWGEACAALAD